MKEIPSLVIIFCISALIACQTSEEKTGNFKLLPQAQKFEITGVSALSPDRLERYYNPGKTVLPVQGSLLKDIRSTGKKSKAQIILSIDSALPTRAEGYSLIISKKQIIIIGKDHAGLFYALQTLEQLMEDASEQDVNLPRCSIMDYPLLSYRAIHLDLKHHIDKAEYYYDLIDQLAYLKINAIIVEMEDKIAYRRQSLVGSADALSINEWKQLSDYAYERNIEISPLIQGLGHADFILKHEEYKSLRDDPESDWAFNPLNPKTYDLQFDLYLDAMEATPHGKYLHVGGDEVHTTGRGSGKSILELQLIWLNKVCAFAKEHQRIPIFWDDMPLKHAGLYWHIHDSTFTPDEVDKLWEENEHLLSEQLDNFPKECIYMRWNYRFPNTPGNAKAMEWFSSHGLKVMGATAGQTQWILMPQMEGNRENILSFVRLSVDKGIDGLLLTLWDDNSPHFELFKRGITWFAEYTWSGESRTKDELKSVYYHRTYSSTLSDPELAFIDQLEYPVQFWRNALLKNDDRRTLISLEDPMTQAIIDFPDPDKKGNWSIEYASLIQEAEAVSLTCDKVAGKILHMKSKAIRNHYTLEVYEQVNKLVEFTATAILRLAAFDKAEDPESMKEAFAGINQLQQDFDIVRKELERVYSKTRVLNKPGNYILSQNNHPHLANQTISFDWQFTSELFFLKKIEATYSSAYHFN